FKIDLTSGQIQPQAKPSPNATLNVYGFSSGVAIFKLDDQTGTYLWSAQPNKPGFNKVAEINTFSRYIATAEAKKIEYRGLDGKLLTGWLLLPFHYIPGKRYPLITWAYAGSMLGDKSPKLFNIGSHIGDYPMCLQLLAARGYAVLYPSMPLEPIEKASDPYLELTKGILPAIDKVIDMGVADQHRLGLIGFSLGGYSVYGLITQTNRFSAAIAGAGPTDLVSSYGTFDAGSRYDDSYHRPYLMGLTENGQFRMGSPLWKDYDRYRRNSPINYVEKVQTPLMIIHGDLDIIPIQQAEQFFVALERQNKRAQFVRYWGENHVIESPANIKDMWRRIYDWF